MHEAAPATTRAIALRFGTTTVTAQAPSGWQVDILHERPAAHPPWTSERVTAALVAARLPAAARGARRAAVLIPDATRVARSDLYLAPILRCLREAGVPDDGVTTLLATGTHAAGDGAREALLGPAQVAYRQHDCDDAAALASAGTTALGNEVVVSRTVLEADLVVLTGRVTNHYFAGYTGGAKAVLPGVAARATILRNHRLVLDTRGCPHPLAHNGVLDGNPVHADMVQAAGLLPGRSFLVNTLVDGRGLLRELFAGKVDEAHRRACTAARAACRVAVPDPYDVVIVGCGGAPADRTFMQALKAPMDWGPAVRPGGVLVWVASCDRPDFERFRSWLTLSDAATVATRAVRDYELVAHNAVLLGRLTDSRQVALVSTLPHETLTGTGITGLRLDEAIAWAVDRAGAQARCLIVDEGNHTFANLTESPCPMS